jgi:hypothetical protein
MVALDFVNAFGFVRLHVLKPAMRINVSINMLFGRAECYFRESATAMPITSGVTRLSTLFRVRDAAEKVSTLTRFACAAIHFPLNGTVENYEALHRRCAPQKGGRSTRRALAQ